MFIIVGGVFGLVLFIINLVVNISCSAVSDGIRFINESNKYDNVEIVKARPIEPPAERIKRIQNEHDVLWHQVLSLSIEGVDGLKKWTKENQRGWETYWFIRDNNLTDEEAFQLVGEIYLDFCSRHNIEPVLVEQVKDK